MHASEIALITAGINVHLVVLYGAPADVTATMCSQQDSLGLGFDSRVEISCCDVIVSIQIDAGAAY